MTKLVDLTGTRFGRLQVLKVGLRVPVNSYWLCKCDCGKEKEVRGAYLRNGTTKSCGCLRRDLGREQFSVKRYGPNKPIADHNGYISVYMPEHPAAGKGGRVRVHRLVMENVLGRYLLPGENVHHKNGDRKDNLPENLELWSSSSQPSGQRVEDQVIWARAIIEQYGELFPQSG